MGNEDLYRNLYLLLKVFKNRPFHLAKYLLDNKALNDSFLKKVAESDKIKNLSEIDENKYFSDINQMNDFFNNLANDTKKLGFTKSDEEISKELSEKLNTLLKEEKYEEAAILRDYMFFNNIKRINKL
jgi:hypothetical protein